MLSRRVIVGLAAVLFLGGVGVGSGSMLVFGPNTLPGEPRSVVIPRGASLDAAIDSLQSHGALLSPRTFRMVAQGTGWGAQIKAGHYRIRGEASNIHLLDRLRRGLQDPVRLTIPPGARPEGVARVAGRRLESSPDAFHAALRDTSLARDLDTTPAHLFGYMLPETYEVYWQTDPERVVRRIKESFDRFYERRLAAGADSLGLSKQEVVTLASIIEWEALLNEEKPMIAGVYLNRLDDGWRLQSDPTIQYVLLQTRGERTRRVLYDDLEIDHPYNTYQNTGLPPGPITNPSPAALRATVRPAQHDYYYFVATGDGGHIFSRTLQEHTRAAQKYQKRLKQRQQDGSSR